MNELHTAYGKKTFVKFKQWLQSDKVIFSFVTKENPTEDHIDIYMDATECGGVLMRKISTGELKRLLLQEKADASAQGRKLNTIWESNFGGWTDENNDSFARKMSIAPGTQQEVVMTAYKYPATKTEDGKYIPISGSSPKYITVGLKYDELLQMQYAWSWLEKDYMPKRYSLENLKDEFTTTSENKEKKKNNKSNPESKKNNKDNNVKSSAPKVTVSVKETNIDSAEKSNLSVFDVTSTSACGRDNDGNIFYEGIDNKTNKKIRVIFTPDVVKKTGSTWNKMQEHINTESTRIIFVAKKGMMYGETAYFFEKVAKAA